MAQSFRYFVFPENGDPLSIPLRVVQGLVDRTDALPQFASTAQRILVVILQNDDGTPETITYYDGNIWHFDETGGMSDVHREHAAQLLGEHLGSANKKIGNGDKVVSIAAELDKRRTEARFHWTPTKEHLDIAAADIWPSNGGRKLKFVRGKKPAPPRTTYAAQRALDEQSEGFWKLSYEIDKLGIADLPGFIHLATERANDPDFAPLYRAFAELGQQRLDLLRARAKKTGQWFAVIEILDEVSDHESRTTAIVHRECSSRDAAVEAGRHMLGKYARYFNERTSVEVRIVPEIEWSRLGYDSRADPGDDELAF